MKKITGLLTLIVILLSPVSVTGQTVIAFTDTVVSLQDTLVFPIQLNSDEFEEVLGIHAELEFDQTFIEVLDYSTAGSISDSLLTVVNNIDGKLFISAASVHPIESSGLLINLVLKPKKAGVLLLENTWIRINENPAFDPKFSAQIEISEHPILEPNDSFEEAIEIFVNDTVYTSMSSIEDVDYFIFLAEEGQVLAIETIDSEFALNLEVSIMNEFGEEILFMNAYSTSGREYLVFGAPYSGEFVIRVAHVNVAAKQVSSDFKEESLQPSTNLSLKSKSLLEDDLAPYQVWISETIPEAPASANSSDGFKSVVPITWETIPSVAYLSVLRYNVYRSESSDGPFSLIGTTIRRDFVDVTVNPGNEYFYGVTAVYPGNEAESEIREVGFASVSTESGFQKTAPFLANTISVDGVINEGEWENSGHAVIDSLEGVHINFWHDQSDFYLGIIDSLGYDSTFNQIGFYFDSDNDHEWDEIEGNYWFDIDNGEITRNQFRSITGTYPNNLSFITSPNEPEGVEVAITTDSTRVMYEVSFSMTESNFNPSIDSTFGLRVFSAVDGYLRGWPNGAIFVSQNTFGEVLLSGLLINNENELSNPSSFSLSQNYPNPFNPSTNISFNLPEATRVSLKVYNMLGKEVATLVNKNLASGTHEVIFDASNLSSGVYIYRISAGDFIQTKKMLLIK